MAAETAKGRLTEMTVSVMSFSYRHIRWQYDLLHTAGKDTVISDVWNNRAGKNYELQDLGRTVLRCIKNSCSFFLMIIQIVAADFSHCDCDHQNLFRERCWQLCRVQTKWSLFHVIFMTDWTIVLTGREFQSDSWEVNVTGWNKYECFAPTNLRNLIPGKSCSDKGSWHFFHALKSKKEFNRKTNKQHCEQCNFSHHLNWKLKLCWSLVTSGFNRNFLSL